MTKLIDHDARRRAITDIGSSLIVEAGAGSGKTSVMASRVAYLMAEGVSPKNIAAVTFTEMAAGELLSRVNEFVRAIVSGDIKPDFASAFPNGASAQQKENLQSALANLNEITCTTIHGFCQRLVKPYPADAMIDPGARIADAAEAELLFEDVFESWLKATLSDKKRGDGMLPIFVQHNPDDAVHTIKTVSSILRSDPGMKTIDPGFPSSQIQDFRETVVEFERFIKELGGDAEPETAIMVEDLKALSDKWVEASSGENSAAALKVCVAGPAKAVLTKQGTVRSYRSKAKWKRAVKAGDAEHLNETATGLYERSTSAMMSALEGAAAHALAGLVEEIRPLIDSFREHKKQAALLDFDDLLHSALHMLRDHEEIRLAAGRRYAHILVDEFQDTDPVQVEIFDMLTTDGDGKPRPGAFFVVGDPKQAIYRFRGADVDTYVKVREKMRSENPDSVLEVSTNFRSSAEILDYVNDKFDGPLSQDDQPGFARLTAFRGGGSGNPAVVSLPVGSDGTSKDIRNEEAEKVAAFCAHLIANDDGIRPSDIALLAPTGTDMWRYEAALEAVGLEVSTQAGKGFFQRQEVQDLIALTRILADKNDTLALGAFLRGPAVGLTDELLLDQTVSLPPKESGHPARLGIDTDPDLLSDPLLKETLSKLRLLHDEAPRTSPYSILSRAVEMFDYRSILRARHEGVSERTLANVGRYLDLSRPYSVRGIRAFSDTMRSAWEEGERQVEGKPDASENAISIITMHSSKGLEWSVVIPINTGSRIRSTRGIIHDVEQRLFTMPLLGLRPTGYDEAHESEAAAAAAERVRLWYVAATRARDMLVLPSQANASKLSWSSIVDFGYGDLSETEIGEVVPFRKRAEAEFGETSEQFASETDAIVSSMASIRWYLPSRKESSLAGRDEFDIDDMIVSTPVLDPGPEIVGGKDRGNVIHKLIEEVITGEVSAYGLQRRAVELCDQYILQSDDDNLVLDPVEIASVTAKTFQMPQVKELEGYLVSELPMGRAIPEEDGERVLFGRADCGWVDKEGYIAGVIDWKSDIDPSSSVREGYRDQLRAYMSMSGVETGLIVYVTLGEVEVVKAA